MQAVDDSLLSDYFKGYRTEPSTPLELDFEAFVSVYNDFVLAQQNGDFGSMLAHTPEWSE